MGTVIAAVSLDFYVWTILCPLCTIEKTECAEYLTLFYRQGISSSECLRESTKIIHHTNWGSILKALLFKQAMSTFAADQIDHWFHLYRFNKICMSIKIIYTYSLKFCLDNCIYFWEALVFLTQLCFKWLHLSLENGAKLGITFLCDSIWTAADCTLQGKGSSCQQDLKLLSSLYSHTGKVTGGAWVCWN